MLERNVLCEKNLQATNFHSQDVKLHGLSSGNKSNDMFNHNTHWHSFFIILTDESNTVLVTLQLYINFEQHWTELRIIHDTLKH